MSEKDINEHRELFLGTIHKVKVVFDRDAFRQIGVDGKASNQVNRAVYDVIMLSFARLAEADLASRTVMIRNQLQKLCADQAFQDAIGRATRDKQRIDTRISKWIVALEEIGLSCPPIPIGS